MDNVTHSLVGAALGRAGLKDYVPGGTVTLVLAANLPDLDVVAGFWGDLYYLTYHRGITHSVLGTAGIAVASSLLLWLASRRRARSYSFQAILFALLLTAATHPLLDYTNSYGLRPFLPFSAQWYYGDLVFIVDPYLWLVLGGALFLSARPGRAGTVFWLSGGALASALVLYAAFQFGHWALFAIWTAGLTAIVLASRSRIFGTRRVAGVGLALMACYWLGLGMIHWHTLAMVEKLIQATHPQVSAGRIAATPRPANPFYWDVFLTEGHTLYHGTALSFRGMEKLLERVESHLDHPAVQAVRATCPAAVFGHFARFEVFQVLDGEDGPTVRISDARFTLMRSETDFGTIRIRLPEVDRIPCPGR
jgi:inner membrane protein